MRRLALLIAPLSLALSPRAEEPADSAARLANVRADERARRLPLAKQCEAWKLWAEAAAEWERVLALAPDDADAKTRLEAAKKQPAGKPSKAQEAQLRAARAAIGKEFGKRYWEAAEAARAAALLAEAENAGEAAAAFDALAGAGDAKARKFFEEMLPKDDPRRRALDLLNEGRKACQVPPLVWSARISARADLHAKYMVTNRRHPSAQGLGGHSEDKSLPDYTPEGEVAARNSDIGFVPPLESMRQMLGTFYHRIPLLDPCLRKVGIAYREYPDAPGTGCCVIDCISGVDRKNVPQCPMIVAWPPKGAKAVRRTFENEFPDPIPPGEDKSSGTAVTVTWFVQADIKAAKFELLAGGKPVEGWFSTPENPARKDRKNGQSVCFIPKDPLPAGTAFRATLTATVDGKPYSLSWDFATEAAPK
ncbi:MAG: hypothetical protein HYY18_15465 [Planctomycetes bacterium]|nr:hypothetical protein [Planctomycetota bacterium]